MNDWDDWLANKREELAFVPCLRVESESTFASTAERRFRKILLLSAVDSFSKVAADRRLIGGKSSRQRFAEFVSKFGDWESASCVSVAVVANPRHPDHVRTAIPDAIRTLARERLPDLDVGARCPLDCDWRYEEFPPDLGKGERFTHAHLLWDYRNSLLHEFHSDPQWCGYGGDDDGDAHYVNVMGESGRCWRPCYTTACLLRLARTGLEQLAKVL